MLDVAAYLARIGHVSGTRPCAGLLAELQLAHLLAVPFENLDVFHQSGVTVDRVANAAAIVAGSGGWCFEANGAFSLLLEELGFAVELLSCRVWSEGCLGPPTDHLALRVEIDEQAFLADVGFGDAFLRPLCLDLATAQHSFVQHDGADRYRLIRQGAQLLDLERESASGWSPQYRLDLTPRRMDDFAERCTALYRDETSMWRLKRFATRATDAHGGRIWLLSEHLKRRDADGRTTAVPIAVDAWESTCLEHFSLRIR